VLEYCLSAQEIPAIRTVIGELLSKYDTTDDPAFLNDATVYSHELPKSLRKWLNDFRTNEPQVGFCLISGYPIDAEQIGATPVHWKDKPRRPSTLEHEILLVLLGSLLGDVFGWATQQVGRVVHDVFPIRGHEKEQLGSSSSELLTWHVEDAFSPYRADYLGLLCLRNPNQAATTVGSLAGIAVPPEDLHLLFESHFTIRPDESHLPKNRPQAGNGSPSSPELLRAAYERIHKMNTMPDKTPVLFGSADSPYLRLDPYFMDDLGDTHEARDAIQRLIHGVDERLRDIILRPGDCIFIDNYQAVHGRKPFRAEYNGKDRWLKRINVTRDLRKSRTAREADSRVVN